MYPAERALLFLFASETEHEDAFPGGFKASSLWPFFFLFRRKLRIQCKGYTGNDTWFIRSHAGKDTRKQPTLLLVRPGIVLSEYPLRATHRTESQLPACLAGRLWFVARVVVYKTCTLLSPTTYLYSSQ